MISCVIILQGNLNFHIFVNVYLFVGVCMCTYEGAVTLGIIV